MAEPASIPPTTPTRIAHQRQAQRRPRRSTSKSGRPTKTSIKNIENVTGGTKDDTITGDKFANVLFGNAGNDTLDGGKGDDTLAGGVGKDQLKGGAGKDFFRFDTALAASNVDKITDFVAKDDTIELDNAVMAALGDAWTQSMFLSVKSGNKATNRTSTSSTIRRRATFGTTLTAQAGGAGPQQIAQLTTHPANVTWLDFQIV